jgi:PAS domain S-box-containing protein
MLELPALELAGHPLRLLLANRAAKAAFGYAGFVPGDGGDWSRRLFAEDEHAFLSCAGEVLRDRGTRTLEHRCRTADGQVRWMSTLFQVGRMRHGRPATALALMMDVTDRRQIYESHLRAHSRETAERHRGAHRLAVQQLASRVLIDAPSVGEAIAEILRAVAIMLDCPLAAYWSADRMTRVLRCEQLWATEAFARTELVQATCTAVLQPGRELPGRAWLRREPLWLDDLAAGDGTGRARQAATAGLRAAAAFPVCAGEDALGVIEIFTRDSRQPDEDVLHLMTAIGHQVAQAVARESAQRALAESEMNKTAIISSALEAIVSTDAEGRIIEMNPAAERIFGRRAMEIFGAPLAELVPAAGGARAGARLPFAGAPLMPGERVEAVIRRADGDVLPVEMTLSQTGDDPLRYTLYAHDLTAQARAVDVVRKSRDDLGLVLQAIPANITVQDETGALIYANDAAAAFCGFPSAAELVKTAAPDIVARFRIWDEEGRVLSPSEMPSEQARTGQTSARTMRMRGVNAKDGDRWVAVRSIPVFDGGTRPVRIVNVFNDITERRSGERWQLFLGEVSAALASSMDVAGLGVAIAELAVRWIAEWCTVDIRLPDGSIRRLAEPAGLPWPSPPSPSRLARAAEAPDPAPAEEAKARLSSGPAACLADGITGPDLATHPTDSAIRVPLVARGEVFGAVTLGTTGLGPRLGPADVAGAEDLARRASITIDNVRLYGEAQESLRAREDLLAIVSHDLRNPLGVVLASSALLLKSSLPPEREQRARRQVEAIQRAGNRMNRLIRDLLDFASIQGGRLSISLRAQSAPDLVAEAIDLLQPLAGQKTLRVENELVGREPVLEVRCDHDRVIQVLSNVVGNAIKFTGEGGTIRVGAEPDGDVVRFFVSDDGPGISAAELPYVFDRYYQARRRNREGIGLGLSIAKGIVDAHGGRIWVESEPGRGSTFFFTLPGAASER